MRGVLSEITCEIAASIPTIRSRSGLGAVVWLWSLRWSSADEPPVTANTPCYRQKGAPDLKPHAARRRELAAKRPDAGSYLVRRAMLEERKSSSR